MGTKGKQNQGCRPDENDQRLAEIASPPASRLSKHQRIICRWTKEKAWEKASQKTLQTTACNT